MIIADIVPFAGQHCETTTTGTLLNHVGIDLSEPMLFGLGEGLGFIYWDIRAMPFPFIGGRIKNLDLTENLARNLGAELNIQTTSSVRTAWKHVQEALDAGQPVGLQLDSYYLDYFTTKVHFAGHFVAMVGYDDTHAFLIDTQQQGGSVTATLSNVEQARNAKGPMAAKNLSYTIAPPSAPPDLRAAVTGAMTRNAHAYLNPPITNIGSKGILKTSREIKHWFARSQNADDFTRTALLMERGGTGGALFRNLYRDFLGECLHLVDDAHLRAAHDLFGGIAPRWTEVARLIEQAGTTDEQQYLDQASAALRDLASDEHAAMSHLARVG